MNEAERNPDVGSRCGSHAGAPANALDFDEAMFFFVVLTTALLYDHFCRIRCLGLSGTTC